MKLVKGDKLGGYYSEIIVIPLGIKDGHNIIVVTAFNSMSRTWNSSTIAYNNENELIVEREDSVAGGTGGPGGDIVTSNTDLVVDRTGGKTGSTDNSDVVVDRTCGKTGGVGDESDNSATEKCCCKVTITVSAGPVNIYVCGSEKSPTFHNIPLQ